MEINNPDEHHDHNIDYSDKYSITPPKPPYKRLGKDDNGERRSSRFYEAKTMETVFNEIEVPSWKNQITLRSIIVSCGLGCFFTLLVMKQNLSTGILHPVGMYAGVVGFSCIRTLTMLFNKSGILGKPFTRQENAVIYNCVVSITGVAISGGYGGYLFGMGRVALQQSILKKNKEPSPELSVKDPSLGWMILFAFVTSFVGIFFVYPLGKLILVDLKLVFPSATAIGHVINCIHAPLSSYFSRKQVTTLGKFFSLSLFWSYFQWVFTGGETGGCGFQYLPVFGFKALEKGFYFDFMGTYVGVGMLVPTITSLSMLLGALLSNFVLMPVVMQHMGDWYPKTAKPRSFNGFAAYKQLISLSIIFGDGLYLILKVLVVLLFRKSSNKECGTNVDLPLSDPDRTPEKLSSWTDEITRSQNYLKDKISARVAIGIYVLLAAISSAVVPLIFAPLKWYHVAVMYIMSPFLAFCKVYATGLTDMTSAAYFSRIAPFIFGAWVGGSHGGVLAGLVATGIVTTFVSSASDLIVDFKTGYLNLASPKSMFLSRLIGTAMGCVICPLTFWYFYSSYPDFGTMKSPFSERIGHFNREIATFGIDGFAGLPKHCLKFCFVAFALAIVLNIIRDILPKKLAKNIPIPTAIAIPFSIGAAYSVDMCIGSLIALLWRWKNKARADAFAPIVAAGLICGDGLFTLQSSIFMLIGKYPPLCAMFVPGKKRLMNPQV
ncbi:Oligopeptide transporter [Quillaja saponaria]|uniref:Oligopeptide transporter n=1 Tax=Quillaja saponaria TaxID=32244 RepID=A0AAD7PN32_QUISA|nr:Oligopeptide transporter [Quillaja saponaria]